MSSETESCDADGPQSEGELVWTRTGDPEFPYAAAVDGQRFTVRLNDFPDEPLYTLLVDDVEVRHFDDWPGTWKLLPSSSSAPPTC